MSPNPNPRAPLPIKVLAGLGVVLIVLPLAGLIQRAAWSSLFEDLSSQSALDALQLSLLTSLAATALALILGLPLAWVLARSKLRGRSIIRALVLVPMVLPPVVGGVALLSAFSLRSPLGGWLHDVFGLQLTFAPAGVILAETFVAMPFFVLTVEAAIRQSDPRVEQIAATLGASPATVMRRVTLPTVAPAIGAGAVLAWARALGEFGATVTFAGNVAGRTRTLPLAVYLALESDPNAAIALSLVLLVVSFAVLVSQRERWWNNQ